MTKKLIPPLAILMSLTSTGCPSKQEVPKSEISEVESKPRAIQKEPQDSQEPPTSPSIEVGAAFLPLELGMTRVQVLKLFPDSEQVLVLVNPSQFAGGYDVSFPDGRSFLLAFDEGDRIRYIATEDRGAKLSNGVGPGTAFAIIRQRCLNCLVAESPGYGTMVEISETEWAVFSYPVKPPLHDVQVVDWVELKSIEASGWASANEEEISQRGIGDE